MVLFIPFHPVPQVLGGTGCKLRGFDRDSSLTCVSLSARSNRHLNGDEGFQDAPACLPVYIYIYIYFFFLVIRGAFGWSLSKVPQHPENRGLGHPIPAKTLAL